MDRAEFEGLKSKVATQLTAKQRLQLIALLGATPGAVNAGNSPAGAARSDEAALHAFWTAVSARMNQRTKLTVMPLAAVLASNGTALREAHKACDKFLAEALASRPSLSRAQIVHAYGVLADVCVARLRRLELPVSPKTVLQQLAGCGEAFEDSFPGYVPAGVAHLPFGQL